MAILQHGFRLAGGFAASQSEAILEHCCKLTTILTDNHASGTKPRHWEKVQLRRVTKVYELENNLSDIQWTSGNYRMQIQHLSRFLHD